MKVYISGKITGLNLKDVKQKFGHISHWILMQGHIPINPIEISPFDENKKWKDYMLTDIEALFDCDAIYMLDNWGQSKGARIEYGIAKELGLKIFFHGDKLQ